MWASKTSGSSCIVSLQEDAWEKIKEKQVELDSDSSDDVSATYTYLS